MVDAGPDRVACLSASGAVFPQVSLNANILSGTPPFTIVWDTLIGIGLPIPLNVNTYLSNVNTLNPNLTSRPARDNLFRIKITDSLGNVCYDSVIVRFGGDFTITPHSCVENIIQGDTAKLGSAVSGTREPLRYAWYPNYNMSDSTTRQPKVWPDSSIYYNVIIKDSFGCQAHFINIGCSVNIVPVGINDAVSENHFDFSVNSKITITAKFPLSRNQYTMRIFDITGKLADVRSFERQIILERPKVGIFIYAIYENDKLVFSKKIKL